MSRPLTFPDGRRFAFTVIDDTDVATVENVAPVYDLLYGLGMRTTKTVWPLSSDAPDSNFAGSQTLEDPDYLAFVLDLQRKGFEVTWHSPAMESSTRPAILEGLERFRRQIGHYPRIHVSHALNRENPYWGIDRVDLPPLRWILRRMAVIPEDHYLGHVEASPYWWGDACTQHIEYGRNLTFDTVNLAKVNPTMPYRDPRRPLVRHWFSGSDANNANDFCQLLRPENQERLERQGGFCIVATHFGKGFASGGEVNPDVKRVLETLAARPGWFPPAGTLLDWLRANNPSDRLPKGEWWRMQVRWLLQGFVRRARYVEQTPKQK